MKEERVPTNKELELYLETLEKSLAEVVAAVSGDKVEFHGLPIEEWAGPGYAVGALFDPYILTSELKHSKICLEFDGCDHQGIKILDTRNSQKERIVFVAGNGKKTELHLPMIWGGMKWNRMEVSGEWRPLGEIAEYPAVAVNDGIAVFAFNPVKVIHRYLNMATPETTSALTDLIIKAVLGASGVVNKLDGNDLRRDFHALGISTLLLNQMHKVVGKNWDLQEILPELCRAAQAYITGNFADAEVGLSKLFQLLEVKRRELVLAPIYIMIMPHGGILFDSEGYAEYDSPELAARVLNLYLDWTDNRGFHFAPDVGAGTLEEFAKLHPKTIKRFRDAWEKGDIEFVNGTYSQPYLQLWPEWNQEKEFEVGLKTFTELFGRQPTVYAAQEIAHHPALPKLLEKYGFHAAIHRSQNLGLTPIDKTALINWHSPDGEGIRALPAHPLRSERYGGTMWRHFPVLLTSARNGELPFIALTSLMDQTFIDIYCEEIVRANRYAPVWGEFLTPSEFFEKTKNIDVIDTCYGLDEYKYHLDLSSNTIHGHQTGGYSSEHAFIFNESARLRKLEVAGKLKEEDLKKLLNQEAHDCYIIPYFAPGYFMEGTLTDYCGPRYQSCNDLPRGLDRFIRDAADYPDAFSDFAPVVPEMSVVTGTTIVSGGHTVKIDPNTGAVTGLDGIVCSLGLLQFNGAPLDVKETKTDGNKLVVLGNLPGFGEVKLEYFISRASLYCEAAVTEQQGKWRMDKICWADCVYLEHAKAESAEVIRTVSGVSQATRLERFHSLDTLELQDEQNNILLRHGGNIFFRQTATAVHNRLWCYDEFCDRFWWAVDLRRLNL